MNLHKLMIGQFGTSKLIPFTNITHVKHLCLYSRGARKLSVAATLLGKKMFILQITFKYSHPYFESLDFIQFLCILIAI